MSYPVTFEADYVERRNRLTAFFRLILAIPLFIWLLVYGIVAELAIVVAWFAIVITGATRAASTTSSPTSHASSRARSPTPLLSDPYPSFGGDDDAPIRCAWSSSRSIATTARRRSFASSSRSRS